MKGVSVRSSAACSSEP